MAGPERIELFIDENSVESGALKAMQTVRPRWKPDEIKFKVFTDGITNKLVGCYLEENKKDMVLVRVYGNKTELLVDRVAEIENMQILHVNGCAPELYGVFTNGLCYGYVHGVVLDTQLIRDPKVSRLNGREMARMHHIQPANGKIPEPSLFIKLSKYFTLIPDSFPDAEKNQRYQKEVPSTTQLQQELESLKGALLPLNSPVVFCHNDLLCKNIVYTEAEDKVTFIDYEYASYNFQAYDIANHFDEFAGVDEVDYSLYPDREFQLAWLRSYLQYFHADRPQPVTDREVETLYIQVNKFALASHFFWGLWALIQARFSAIDFDFLDYGILRFNEYLKRKDEFLGLQLPE
ncbi:ethanolamine kinase 1-like isoform X1 [Branchiostoma floridae x Branchiostoma japonicum]